MRPGDPCAWGISGFAFMNYPDGLPGSVHIREVNEAPLDVRGDQFDGYPIADVEPLVPTHYASLDLGG